ncbi:uncharacterized protein V6R79_026044 [Siganus canaliculatus]
MDPSDHWTGPRTRRTIGQANGPGGSVDRPNGPGGPVDSPMDPANHLDMPKDPADHRTSQRNRYPGVGIGLPCPSDGGEPPSFTHTYVYERGEVTEDPLIVRLSRMWVCRDHHPPSLD